MQEENKTKLVPAEEVPSSLDLRRDYQYGRGAAAESEDTHLRDYWRIVRRRLWVPISLVVLTVTLTTIYMLRLPSVYEGVTTVEMGGDSGNIVNLSKEVQINMGADAQYINTQLRNMQTPKVALLVVKALNLEKNTNFIPGLKADESEVDTLQVMEDDGDEAVIKAEIKRLQPYIDTLLGGVDAKPVRETRLVQIRYRHEVPELAQKISDAWAEAFIADSLIARRKNSRESALFLEGNIAKYRLNLRAAEEALLNYRKANQILDFGAKESTVLARLATINQLLLQAENERKAAQMSYEMSRQVNDLSILPEMQKDPLVQTLIGRLTDLRTKKAQLEVEFTSEWPEVKAVDQQVARLEGELRASYQRILTGIENQYHGALKKEEDLRNLFAEQQSETINEDQGAIQAKMLQQEVDTNREMLKGLLESQKNVEVAAAGIKPNIRITDYSPTPGSPVAPRRLQAVLLSLFLSLVAGIALVLFLDYINNKIETVEDIDRYLRLPALGVIPSFQMGGKARRLLGAGGGSKELAPAGVGGKAASGAVILTQVEATSSIAESYRQLRTALLLSSAGHAPRTLLVTSTQPAEGKTTTSVNMAISLAQTGAAVLIVDADLRRPRVHKIFGVKNTVGLCNYLAGDYDLASLIQLAMPNLYVLPVGPLPPNPAELLGSAKMKQVVEALASNFDYVVIDSPPVSSFADSLILSSLVDGVIIVVKGSFTPREMAQRTKAHLQAVGAKILGVVVNSIKLQPHDYYYYSTYYSRYYYGDGDESREGAVEG